MLPDRDASSGGRAVLQLLPPICRDCGKDAAEAKLSAYLDFHLCPACIAAREREVMKVDGPKRRAPSKKSRREATVRKATKPGKPKATRKPVSPAVKKRAAARKPKRNGRR